MSYNKVTLLGRLGKDPEIKEMNNNLISKISVATNSKIKGEPHTEWFNVVFFNKLAEMTENLKKGQMIFCEGRLQTTAYKDKNGNEKRFSEVICDTFRSLEPKEEDAPQPKSSYKRTLQVP